MHGRVGCLLLENFPSLCTCSQNPVSFCPIGKESSTGRFDIETGCQRGGFDGSCGTVFPRLGTHPEPELCQRTQNHG